MHSPEWKPEDGEPQPPMPCTPYQLGNLDDIAFKVLLSVTGSKGVNW